MEDQLYWKGTTIWFCATDWEFELICEACELWHVGTDWRKKKGSRRTWYKLRETYSGAIQTKKPGHLSLSRTSSFRSAVWYTSSVTRPIIMAQAFIHFRATEKLTKTKGTPEWPDHRCPIASQKKKKVWPLNGSFIHSWNCYGASPREIQWKVSLFVSNVHTNTRRMNARVGTGGFLIFHAKYNFSLIIKHCMNKMINFAYPPILWQI